VAHNPDVLAAEAQLRAAAIALAHMKIVAPVDGVVAQRTVQVGQRVNAGAPLMAVVPLSNVWVDANFKEGQLSRMRIGQPVNVTTDIYGGNTVEEAAKLFAKILKGEGSWAQNAVVLANAAMALQCTGNYASYEDAYAAAVESLEKGKANDVLKKLLALQVG